MGLRGMRVRKSPLVRVLYAEATRPFPVNAKGAGPQTSTDPGQLKILHRSRASSNDSNYENKKYFFPLAKLNAPMVPSFR